MEHKLNSELFPIISVGMYNSQLSIENIYDDDYEISFSEHSKKIEDLAKRFLKGKHESSQGVKITISVGEIYSPNYYNFKTDQIDMDISFNKKHVMDFASDNSENFEDFLRENYSSCDGFTSYTPNNFLDWVSRYEEEEVQSIGAILTFAFKDNLLTDEFYNYVADNMY